MFSLNDFKAFIDAYKWFLTTCVVMGGTGGVVTDFATSIGPPWPDTIGARSLISTVCGVVVCVVIFSTHWRVVTSKKTRGAVFKRYLVLVIVSGIAYLILYALFTYKDDKGVAHSKGLFYSDQLIAIMDSTGDGPAEGGLDLRKVIKRETPDKQKLQHVGYDEFMIWSESSIVLVRCGLLLLWAAFFSSLSSLFGIFIISEERVRQSATRQQRSAKRSTQTAKNGNRSKASIPVADSQARPDIEPNE